MCVHAQVIALQDITFCASKSMKNMTRNTNQALNLSYPHAPAVLHLNPREAVVFLKIMVTTIIIYACF